MNILGVTPLSLDEELLEVEAPPSEILMYDEGTEHVLWVAGFTNGSGGQVKDATYLEMWAQNINGERTWVIDQAIDLTEVDDVVIRWSQLNYGAESIGAPPDAEESHLVVSTDKNASHATFVKRTTRTARFTNLIDRVDVKDLGGAHYVRVHARSTAGFVESRIHVHEVIATIGLQPPVLTPGPEKITASGLVVPGDIRYRVSP